MSILNRLNTLYDDNVHPAVMKVINKLGLGDNPSVGASTKQVTWPDGRKVTETVPGAANMEEFYRLLGKTSLGVAGIGGLGGLLTSIGTGGHKPLAANRGTRIPLTAREQQMLLEEEEPDYHFQRRKFGSTETRHLDGTMTQSPSGWKSLGDTLWHENPIAQNWRRLQGKPAFTAPAPKKIDTPADAPPPPAAPPGNAASAVTEYPFALPLGLATLIGAGGLGYMGARGLMNFGRKRRLRRQRDRAKQRFLETLASERETKLSSAIDAFVSACEEKVSVKEASAVNTFLALLGTAGVLGGGLGLFNGLKSERGDLQRIRALREARKRQLAMQEEFEPRVDPDLSFLPQWSRGQPPRRFDDY